MPPPRRALADYPPGRKLLLLLAGVGAATLAIKAVGLLLGAPGDWFQFEDRNLSQFLFLAGAVLMMALDRVSLADCGLAFPERWGRRLVLAFLIGLAVVCAYYALAASLGALDFRIDRLGRQVPALVLRVARAFARSSLAHVAAFGYVFALLRRRYGIASAVGGTALLFALFFDPAETGQILVGQHLAYFLGVLLGAVLLGLLRCASGSLLPGIGVMAGWLLMQDLVRRGRLVGPGDGSAAVVAWFAPGEEILAAPALWLLLTAGILGLVLRLRLRGEPVQDPRRGALPASFKRFYPLAQPNAFAPLDLWLARLVQARFRVGPVYLLRLACTLLISAANTIVSLPERLLLPLVLPFVRVPDPIFVVGVHRSGTTWLHNLLSLDPASSPPRLYQVSNPLGFVFSGWLMVPLMACAPSRRPMDTMQMHVFSASEDEFALANSTYLSPYWGPVFPREVAYYDSFIHPEDLTPRQQRRWERAYMAFCRRLSLFSRKRPLFKNPYNTARVRVLRRLFPDARFVHIVRSPEDVYRSNMKLTDEGFLLFQLQDPDERESFKTRFCAKYRRMEEAYYRDAAALPADRVAEVRFEELERNPLGVIETIYARLGLPISAVYRARLEQHLKGVAGYRKNVHAPLDPEVAREIEETLGPLLDRWGYPVPRATVG